MKLQILSAALLVAASCTAGGADMPTLNWMGRERATATLNTPHGSTSQMVLPSLGK